MNNNWRQAIEDYVNNANSFIEPSFAAEKLKKDNPGFEREIQSALEEMEKRIRVMTKNPGGREVEHFFANMDEAEEFARTFYKETMAKFGKPGWIWKDE